MKCVFSLIVVFCCVTFLKGITSSGTISAACGGTFTTDQGVLEFPKNDTQDYDDNMDCVWVLETTPGKALQLNFTRFDIEDTINCMYDYLQLDDGIVDKQFCGDIKPGDNGEYNTTHNYIRLVFHSDSVVTRRGFGLTWKIIEPACGGSFTSEEGEIEFPEIPSLKYDNNADCVWHLATSSEKVFNLSFTSFYIEDSINCQFDYLKIEDGLFAPRFCGNQTKPGDNGVYISSMNTVRLIFHSDESIADKGFKLSWKVVAEDYQPSMLNDNMLMSKTDEYDWLKELLGF